MPFLEKRAINTEGDTRGSHGLGTERAIQWTRDEYIPGHARDTVRPLPQRVPHKQPCGNIECSGRWTMPWKNRRRPIFEGSWGCSTRCLQAVIGRALRREGGDLRSIAVEEAPHQHRVPLGLVLLGQGWITQAQLRTALEAQRLAGTGRIGEWLVQESGVPAAMITRGLAVQWGCPVLPIEGFIPSTMALSLPAVFVRELGLVPIRIAASRIFYLAFGERLDASAAFAVGQMSGLRVESGLLDDAQFGSVRGRLLQSSFVEVKEESFKDIEGLAERITSLLDACQPLGSRLVRVHQRYWLRTWLESGSYSGVGTLPSTGEDVVDTLFTLASNA